MDTAGDVTVGLPLLVLAVDDGVLPGDNANREACTCAARQDFDAIDERHVFAGREMKVEESVRCRMEIFEHLFRGNVAGTGLGVRVKISKDWLLIREDVENAGSLSPASPVPLAIHSFCEIQMKFVGAWGKWDIVPKITLTL